MLAKYNPRIGVRISGMFLEWEISGTGCAYLVLNNQDFLHPFRFKFGIDPDESRQETLK